MKWQQVSSWKFKAACNSDVKQRGAAESPLQATAAKHQLHIATRQLHACCASADLPHPTSLQYRPSDSLLLSKMKVPTHPRSQSWTRFKADNEWTQGGQYLTVPILQSIFCTPSYHQQTRLASRQAGLLVVCPDLLILLEPNSCNNCRIIKGCRSWSTPLEIITTKPIPLSKSTWKKNWFNSWLFISYRKSSATLSTNGWTQASNHHRVNLTRLRAHLISNVKKTISLLQYQGTKNHQESITFLMLLEGTINERALQWNGFPILTTRSWCKL